MAGFLVRCLLFLSSYFPLLVIFGILLIGKHSDWAIALLIIGLLSVTFMALYLAVNRRILTVIHDTVTSYQKHDADVMGYIASYLIPFVTFPTDDPQQMAALFVFASVLLVVYVNSNMIYINPMLNLFGYHLYEVEIEHSALSHYYIARKRVVRNEAIHFVRLSDDIFLEK
ncbi:MAG: hypothetical protein J2P37_02985 [Ktedonobacteraceae bacterium]|nr:hypothetical protein [Ktedonobacteraceae bacterium]